MAYIRAITLVWCLAVGPAIASQYVAGTTTRVELTSHVRDPELNVTVVAEIAAPNEVGALDSLIVSYGDVTIRVPRKILDFSPNPVLGSLRLFYCGRASTIFMDEDGNEVDRLDPGDEPCLSVNLSFSDQACSEHENCDLPYISVQILDGKIVGFEIWQFDGVNYQVQFNEELGVYGPF